MEKLEIDVAEDAEAAARLFFANGGISRFCAIRHDHHADLPSVAQMECDQPSAADDLVVGMRCKDEQPLAA